MKKVLLYSGGLDSWLISQIWKPDMRLYVNMHTEYSQQEIDRLPQDVKVVDFPLGRFSLPNSIIPLRNMYLYMVACNVTGFEDAEICLGALNGDRINDKSLRFIDLLNPVLSFLYEPQQSQPGRKVRLVMPYKENSKRELLNMYVAAGGTLREAWEQTFSCYHPKEGRPCLSCKACFRKAIPFIVAGMDFTHAEKAQLVRYVKTAVMENMDDYTKNKGKEGIDCMRALEVIATWRDTL